MEWVVVDDGGDPVDDLFKDVRGVRYYRSEERMNLGHKRNFMHSKENGEILVYMDDDDYYPPDRVLHAVNKLRSNPNVLIAGSSKMFIYFRKLDKIYQFGPYHPNHATAGTFAFRKKLLNLTSFEDHANVSEERFFLKNYTIPMVQLDSKRTILVFAHSHNTFDKNQLLVNPDKKFVRETKFSPSVFVKNKELREFYISQ
jgi:glycosyltransferase involved in cell wall biosynthesis